MNWELLAKALDKQNPDWYLKYADQRDLRDYIDQLERSGQDSAVEMLRSRVVRELFEVCRAAVHAGLLKEV